MLLFFAEVLQAWAEGGNVLAYLFGVLAVFNFLPELAINVVFSPAGQRITHFVEKN